MLRIFLIACAFAFLGGLVTGKSVLAQTNEPFWASKPIQCGPTRDAITKASTQGLVPAFVGYGYSTSVNYDKPIPVLVMMFLNPVDKKWAIMEVGGGGKEVCIIGNGDGTEFSTENIMNIIQGLLTE